MGLGCYNPPCSLAAVHTPMQGCCQYSSNQLGLRETEVNSQYPCAQKYRDVILQGVSETHYIKCLCPVPLLGAELASLCTNKMCNGFVSVFCLYQLYSSAQNQLNPTHDVVCLFLRMFSCWGGGCPLWGRLEMLWAGSSSRTTTWFTALR